jgi:hypothetical protein
MSSNPNYLPKAPSPNTITLEVRASKHKLGKGEQNSIYTLSFLGPLLSQENNNNNKTLPVPQCLPFALGMKRPWEISAGLLCRKHLADHSSSTGRVPAFVKDLNDSLLQNNGSLYRTVWAHFLSLELLVMVLACSLLYMDLSFLFCKDGTSNVHS